MMYPNLDLMKNAYTQDVDLPRTAWSPIGLDTGLAFCSCLACGATLMFWYNSEGNMVTDPLRIHTEFHDRKDYGRTN